MVKIFVVVGNQGYNQIRDRLNQLFKYVGPQALIREGNETPNFEQIESPLDTSTLVGAGVQLCQLVDDFYLQVSGGRPL